MPASHVQDMSTPVRDLRTGGNVHQLSTRVGEPVELRDLDSALLLQGQREVRIRHGNEIYRLRHTRNDKLILTK